SNGSAESTGDEYPSDQKQEALSRGAGRALLVSSERSDALDDRARALRPTSTHRDQRGGLVLALELVQGGGQQSGSRRADRVTDRDSAAVDVVLVLGNVVDLRPAHHDGGERL